MTIGMQVYHTVVIAFSAESMLLSHLLHYTQSIKFWYYPADKLTMAESGESIVFTG